MDLFSQTRLMSVAPDKPLCLNWLLLGLRKFGLFVRAVLGLLFII